MFSRNRGKTPEPERSSRRRTEPANGRSSEPVRVPEREFGPYDQAEAPDDDGNGRLDLGALKLPKVAGVEIQLNAGPEGQIQQIVCGYGRSQLHLGVFAAPRTEGIWDDVRTSLRTSMAQAGSTQQDVTGDYGPELRVRLKDPQGTPVEARHLGVDGPRWFVHGVFLGEAAVDPGKAGPLVDVLRGLVVDRGTDARPVGEALPLRLPPEAAAQLAAQVAANQAQGGAQQPPQAQPVRRI
jgi:hypothetical protein